MKALVIGYGSIGKRHLNVLSEMEEIDEIAIVTKQEVSGYRTYSDITEINGLFEYDYFVIASITSLHEEQLIFLNNNVKNKTILIEKPLSTHAFNLNLSNKVYVAYNLRFHPILQKLKRICETDKILNVNIQTGQYLPSWRPGRDYKMTYSASAEKGGGVLFDLSHELDYLIWIFGKVKSFNAINSKISDLDITSDDFFSAIGVLDSGAIFNISIDYISKIFMREIVINTEIRTYYADLLKNELVCAEADCEKKVIYSESINSNFTYSEMHKQVISKNVDGCLSTFKDGVEVLTLIEEIRRCANAK